MEKTEYMQACSVRERCLEKESEAVASLISKGMTERGATTTVAAWASEALGVKISPNTVRSNYRRANEVGVDAMHPNGSHEQTQLTLTEETEEEPKKNKTALERKLEADQQTKLSNDDVETQNGLENLDRKQAVASAMSSIEVIGSSISLLNHLARKFGNDTYVLSISRKSKGTHKITMTEVMPNILKLIDAWNDVARDLEPLIR